MAENGTNTKNELIMVGRKSLSLDGVRDILAFDNDFILLSTDLGVLTVEGAELHIDKSDTQSGKLSLSGQFDALIYTDDKPSRKKGLFGKRK